MITIWMASPRSN